MKYLTLRILIVAGAVFQFATRVNAAGNTNEIPQLRPLHAELQPTFWEQHGNVVIIAMLAVLVLSSLIVLALMRSQPAVVIPPAEQARQAMAALPADVSDGVTLSRISQILRHYVQRAFELPQDQLTTTEFCERLSSNDKIGLALALALSEFLRDNDVRKFSAVTPAQSPVSPIAHALALIEKCEARRGFLQGGQIIPASSTDKPA